MNAPEDALAAKAAEALWDSLLGKYKRGEFTECPEQHLPWWHEQARGVIAVVRDQIAAEALREAADEIRLGLSTSNYIGQGAEMACRQLDARADRLDPEGTEPTPEEIRQRQVDDADDQQAERYEQP